MKIDFNFKREDWVFEISSGYKGYRNIHTAEWIYDTNYNEKVNLLKEFDAFKKLLIHLQHDIDVELLEEEFELFKKEKFLIFKS
jgi:hypothetical protein